MEEIKDYDERIGLLIPEILLPKDVDLAKWSVVACDQYTSEPGYWESVSKIVGNNPSTLNIIYPEAYLDSKDKQKRIAGIQDKMSSYAAKILRPRKGLVYVERKTGRTSSRKGLIVALDLEKYDYNKGSQSMIRATEGTVLERLPPRVQIRKDAIIESPHIMVLIDDPEKTVIEPIAARAAKMEKLYDFNLMMDGGHIAGYIIDDPGALKKIKTAIGKLADRKSFNKKYHLTDSKDREVLLYAVGDGNHSLATAKSCWDILKPTLAVEQQRFHPARFALVELVNVHDEGIRFEPIHRVLFKTRYPDIIKKMTEYYKREGCAFTHRILASSDDLKKNMKAIKSAMQPGEKVHVIKFKSGKVMGIIAIKNPAHTLEVGTLQSFLDEYTAESGVKVDYIHGDDAFNKLSTTENLGFYLPAMDKRDLFKTVILEGALARKTFSMGEPEEKRYYLECRKIR